MRKSIYLIVPVITFLLLSFVVYEHDVKKKLNLNEALTKKMLSVEVQSLGGHTGECIQLNVQSNLYNDTMVYLEPGRRFLSKDSTIQDILIVKESSFLLAGRKKMAVRGFGFCCQASNGSPYTNAVFYKSEMADSNLVELARFLNKNNYSNSAMQGAVWVLSDSKPLSAIWDGDKENANELRKLQKFVARLAGISIDYAWYSIKYKADTAALFSGIHDTLTGEVEYNIYHNSEVSLVMYDSIGDVIHTFFRHKMQGPGEYVYPVEFSVSEWPTGKYYIRLFSDGQMKEERIFQL